MPSISKNIMKRFATPLGPESLEGHELRTVVFVAISFQLVFTGYRSIQNLQSSLNEEQGLGVISLGVLHGAWIFSGFLTPTALRFLTTKGALMVAWVSHALYTASTFYPAWELIVPSSFLVGVFSAPLWTSQSLYITACGFSRAKEATDSPYHIFSRFNGIFFAIYETSQITGNMISSLVLQSGVGNRSDEIIFQQCGRGDCPTADNATDFEEPEDWVIDVLLATYVTFSVIGLLITYVFVIPLPKSDWSIETSTKETVTSFFVTLRRTSIGLLVPLFIFQGMQQAILYSEFTRSYVSCPVGIHMVGFVMATHGATTPLTTWLFSRVVKHTGRYPLFVLAGLVNLGLMIIMYLWTPNKTHLPFLFLMPIAWGVSEGIWLTQSNSLIAVQFSKQKEPAFAIYHTSRSIGLALTFSYSSILCATVKLTIGMTFALFGLLSYTVAEFRIRWKEKRKDSHYGPDSQMSSVSGGLDMAGVRPDSFADEDLRPYFELEGRKRNMDLNVEGELSSPSLCSPVNGEFSYPEVSPTEQHVPGILPRVPSIASSSSSLLTSLTMMARLSQSEGDELVPSLPEWTPHRLSESVSEECFF